MDFINFSTNKIPLESRPRFPFKTALPIHPMFIPIFYGLSVLCALLFYYTRTKVETCEDANFKGFQKTYITVYLLAVAGDWLQGPHVYALSFSLLALVHLYFFGTIIGSFADKFGRRNNCLLYALLYGGACVTKHFNDINILMIGRFLGGIATSILYSAFETFESWLVFEHNKRGFSDDLLGTVFSNAALGNSLVAILSGVAAQMAADTFGYVAPFDLSMLVLGVMFFLVYGTWTENYGNESAALQHSFKEAANTIRNDVKVLCLGLVQSLFEGAIYVLFIAAICLSVPIFMPSSGISIFIGFLVFEGCVGIFWPAMGFLRGVYVPEETRSTTINLFRIPLNLIVVFILLQNFSMLAIFHFCVFFLLLAACAQHVLST
ncbi:unnamed protein product, partial [Mesorhabditis belari]|uniref:Uncharacterized protein n=1 Tax=Mesorhabditis belari TaxID=2138241 RepID=A0AAF3FF03_9BILA